MGGIGCTRWTGVATRYETGECLRLDAQGLSRTCGPERPVAWSGLGLTGVTDHAEADAVLRAV